MEKNDLRSFIQLNKCKMKLSRAEFFNDNNLHGGLVGLNTSYWACSEGYESIKRRVKSILFIY